MKEYRSLKIRIIYIISLTDKALAFEWFAQILNKDLFDPHFILLNPHGSPLENFLKEQNLSVTRISYSGKKDILKAFFFIYRFLRKEKKVIVHTHLFDASFIGLTAARLAGIKERIHTRHHSNSHWTYTPHAVKYDQVINRLSTHIIAISRNVSDVLMKEEKVPAEKIRIIHHGLDLTEADKVNEVRIDALKDKYHLTRGKSPVIGVISRYIHLKGIQYIIPAFKKLLLLYPEAHLILANTKGNYKQEILMLLGELPAGSYTEVPFEEDLFAFYHLFDLYVHVPIDSKCEAFGQTYIESLLCGIPSVFTLSGIANEFITDHENALVAEYQDSESIFEKMVVLLQNRGLCSKLSEKGKQQVREMFDIRNTVVQHEQLYSESQNGI